MELAGTSRSIQVPFSARQILQHLFQRRGPASSLEYWRRRARRHGAYAVLNLSHGAEKLEGVTHKQKQAIYPVLKERLRGDEQIALDFGCGTGRFTTDLATLVAVGAIGVDPIRQLLELAPAHPRVDYRLMTEDSVPLSSHSADLVWICLVLGCITDANLLQKAVSEIERVLKPGGLILLVENTSRKPNGRYWHFRSAQAYQKLFRFVSLQWCSSYEDLGEEISILAGR